MYVCYVYYQNVTSHNFCTYDVKNQNQQISPVFGRMNTVQNANFFSLASQLLGPNTEKSAPSSEPIAPAINSLRDFYMTDSISRSSQTMAKCISE